MLRESSLNVAWTGRNAMPTRIFGRNEELSFLNGLVARTPVVGTAIAITGAPGSGKSEMLRAVGDQAHDSGLLVLTAIGRQHESTLEGAILRELLGPISEDVSSLSRLDARAIKSAVGLSETPPHDVALSVAVLNLLSAVADRTPLLISVDNSHWSDETSRKAISFAVHRLKDKPVVFAFGVEKVTCARQFEADLPEVRLEPMSKREAGLLLDSLPNRPRGHTRLRVLESASGNPLALIEFSSVASATSEMTHSFLGEPLPLSPRMMELVKPRGAISKKVKDALLTVAVVEEPDRVHESMHELKLRTDGLSYAERIGLIKVGEDGPRFCSPLQRSALYHSATYSERAAAHERLSEVLKARPDRQAWHLSASLRVAPGNAADLLESTAEIALLQDGPASAAILLERAAELASRTEVASRRFVMSSRLALRAGEYEWAFTLAGAALALPSTTEEQFEARLCSGGALILASQFSSAVSALSSLVIDASLERSDVVFDALELATTAQLHSGDSGDRAEAIEALGVVSRFASPTSPNDLATSKLLWAQVGTSSISSREDAVQRLWHLCDRRLDRTSLPPLAMTAWLLDESELAVKICRRSWEALETTDPQSIDLAVAEMFGWSCVDTGRWDEALNVAAEVNESCALPAGCSIVVAVSLIVATIQAMRGGAVEARRLALSALAASDPVESRSTLARARHALGLVALGDRNYDSAYAYLRKLFELNGDPLHRQWSFVAIGDLASAACRVGRGDEVSLLIERALIKSGGGTSPRIEQSLWRARALCADGVAAEAYFDKALSDQEGVQWPFERAQLTLDYAEWLRRRRRINEAKSLLFDCLEIFQRVGATPWAERAEAELRACGTTVKVRTDGLEELTPQEREIVLLASKGLSNREIGERMFISARTVGSHLYRLFPKLGVSSRQQLRDFAEPILQAKEGEKSDRG